MTENLMSIDLDEEVSIDSTSSSSSDTFLVYEKSGRGLMTIEEKIDVDEDEKFDSDFNVEESKENFKTRDELAEEREKEIKEKRFKRLMHLLNNSKMYSVILKDRIKQDEATVRKKEGTSKGQNKDLGSKKKTQIEYNVCDVLSEKNIEQNMIENGSKSSLEQVEEDYFKETRKTELGFTVSYKQPILLEGGAMRDYQLKGLDWMKNLFKNGVSGILADEMGLGKTIQVISFICHLIEENIQGPFLIIAPLSTVSNWMAEFKKFAPKVPILLYYGSEEKRKELVPKIFQKSKVLKKSLYKVIITSYQVPLRDKAILRKINWYYLIVDEGHRLKNHNSILSRTLREFNTIGRLLLTGTPLQNDLSELWSLLNFLLPEVFNNLDVFQSWFNIKELESNGTKFMQEKFNINIVTILQEILEPFLLRREKKDVDLKLPPKKENLIFCPMTPLQKKLYEAFLDRSIEKLLKPKDDFLETNEPLPKRRSFMNSPFGGKELEQQRRVTKINVPKKEEEEEMFSTHLVLQNPQMQLRKIVNHPYLIQHPLKNGTEELRIDEELVTQSGKLLVLDTLLKKLKARGHKVIVFSCFKILLDILEEHANMRGYKYCRLDGDLKISDRDEEIMKFNSDPEIFVFYISIRAGGLGLNLTAADTVIFFDSDWNPQVNLQSEDRCHRIGQTKPVVVYRLCSKGTIDERIIERGNAKRRLEKMILQNGKFAFNSKYTKKLNLMDFQELKKLLECTDHDAVIDSNGFVLTDEELEILMDRSNLTNDNSTEETNEHHKFKVLKNEKC